MAAENLAERKKTVRRQLRRARMMLPAETRRQAQRDINRCLKKFLKRGRKTAVYRAAGSEAGLAQVVQAAQRRGVPLYEPYWQRRSRRLFFVPWGAAARTRGRKIRIESMHTVFLPLIGADFSGNRLGQGGGYYDTSLRRTRGSRPRRIGVGFSCQLLPEIPHGGGDEKLHFFVSEKGCMDFLKKSQK